MWFCKHCKRFWHYALKQCAYCGGALQKEEAKKLKVIGVTEVRVPSLEHPDVPYYVLLLEDEKGFKHLRKSMEKKEVGEGLSVKAETKKLPALGVVGTGAMASGLVLTALKGGMEVIAKSRTQESLEKLKRQVEASLGKTMNDPEDVRACLQRLELTTHYADLKACDFIVENVVEKLGVKKEVFRELDQACPPHVILASNTSSLLVQDMAEGLKRPERVVGMHFFNPVERMRLVEIIPMKKTSKETIQKTKEVAVLLGKTVVEVKDAPGFIVNRVLFPFLNEAVLLVEQGTAKPEDVDQAVKLGLNHPMGPLALIDLIGVDVFVEIMDNLKQETGDIKFTAAKLARKMVKEGKLGRKTKEGFYRYG